jgi:hypothetical protein
LKSNQHKACIEAAADLMSSVEHHLAGSTMKHCLETIQFIWIPSAYKSLNQNLIIDDSAFGLSTVDKSIAVKKKFDLEVEPRFFSPPPSRPEWRQPVEGQYQPILWQS